MLNLKSKKQPEAIIACRACSQPLWKFKVLGTFSKSMEPVGSNTAEFQENNINCPLCGCAYFTPAKKKGEYPVFNMIDMNGKPFKLD